MAYNGRTVGAILTTNNPYSGFGEFGFGYGTYEEEISSWNKQFNELRNKYINGDITKKIYDERMKVLLETKPAAPTKEKEEADWATIIPQLTATLGTSLTQMYLTQLKYKTAEEQFKIMQSNAAGSLPMQTTPTYVTTSSGGSSGFMGMSITTLLLIGVPIAGIVAYLALRR